MKAYRGGSRIFSRGDTTFFFRTTKLIFRALPKQCFVCPYFGKFSAPQANFWKKQSKKPFFFLKNFDKKIAFFFGARSPSKLVYIGAKGAFGKILGSVGQKWISEKVSKGGPFGSAGGRIPEEGAYAPPPQIRPWRHSILDCLKLKISCFYGKKSKRFYILSIIKLTTLPKARWKE